ncbi:transposase, partial [Alkalibacterium sp. m-11]
QEKVKYIIRLKVNARLKNMAQQKVLYAPDTDFTHKESQYFKINYQAKSWETGRKAAVKATREAGELLFTTFEFIVSNFVDIPAQTVYKLYQKRGTME